jgi:hypothetical protein
VSVAHISRHELEVLRPSLEVQYRRHVSADAVSHYPLTCPLCDCVPHQPTCPFVALGLAPAPTDWREVAKAGA